MNYRAGLTPVLLLLLFAPARAGGNRPTTLEVEMDIYTQISNTSTKQTRTETQNHRIWIKGNRVRREERTILGIQILIESEGVQYLIDPTAKQALRQKIPRPIFRPDYPTFFDPEGFEDWLARTGARKSGSEKLDDADCEIYTQTEGSATVKRWVRKGSFLPVKTEARGPGGRETLTFKRIKPGAEVADSMFQVPSGYKIQDVASARPPAGKSSKGKKK